MKSLSHIDLGENQLWNPVIHPSTTAPIGPSEGQVYYDPIEKTLKLWVGSNWVSLGTSGGTGTSTSQDNSLLVEGSSGDTLLI